MKLAATQEHHADEVADAGRVGNARRKLVVNLIHVHDVACQSVGLLMETSQFVGLLPKQRVSDDEHINTLKGMEVLVGDGLPRVNRPYRRRAEQRIASLRMRIGSKHEIVGAKNAFLHHRTQRFADIPKLASSADILHPDGRVAAPKLRRRYPEGEKRALANEPAPIVHLDIVQIQDWAVIGGAKLQRHLDCVTLT